MGCPREAQQRRIGRRYPAWREILDQGEVGDGRGGMPPGRGTGLSCCRIIRNLPARTSPPSYIRMYVSFLIDRKQSLQNSPFPEGAERGDRMARSTGSNGARTAAAIRRAALGLIYRQGFAAMNLRDLAAEVGIQPSSLYNHITSKQALLFDLMQEHMQTLLDSTDAALAAAEPALMERLRAFLAHHVLYHMERRQEVYIANFELRALDPP